jgi:hypothetical protein
LDRLARLQLHLLQIIEEIEGKGAKLVSLMDNIDTGTATGKMMVGVLAVLAEFERNLLMERCRWRESGAGRTSTAATFNPRQHFSLDELVVLPRFQSNFPQVLSGSRVLSDAA